MITGNKNDIAKLLPFVSPELQVALKYVAETDFAQVANGEYELEGRKLFARVNTYATEPKADRRPEKHDKYIDVQYVASGSEEIFFTPLTDKVVMVEDKLEKEDVAFYADPAELNSVKLEAGDFAIFFPWELHRPNCSAEHVSSVQKVVVKVQA